MIHRRTTLRSFLAFALATVLFFIAGMARAQEVTGSISGTVTDASGAVVKGATVVVTDTDRNQVVRKVTTDAHGFYKAGSLPVGTYSVAITADKFSSAVTNGLPLHANDALTVNQKMAVGTATDRVTVQAEQVQINLENAASQGVINGTQVRELILNNRNYEQLLALQPGVVYGGTSDNLYIGNSLPNGATNTLAFSINGQRSSTNDWTIDGADNLDRGSNLTTINYPSVDAIAEFKTLRGTYSAAYGRTASAQINIITKSGTNDLHGSLYEFFRNDVFNANNYFSKLTTPVTPRGALRYNDFGGTIGGPVVLPHIYDGRDKTFFFFSEEIRRVVTAAPEQVFEPLQTEIGITTPGVYTFADTVCTSVNPTTGACNATGNNVIPNSTAATAYIRDVFSKLPLPNPGAGQDPHSLTYNAKSYFNDEQELVRVDHKVNDKLSLFYRFIHDSVPTIEANGLFTNTNSLPGVNTTSTRSPGTNHLGHATYVLTPHQVFDFGYAYTSGAILSKPIGLNGQANSPDIHPALPYTSTLNIVPILTFQNGTSITGPGVYNDYSKNHNIFGSWTWTWRQHVITIGASINHYEKTENNTVANAGTFAFNGNDKPVGAPTAVNIEQSYANFLLGVANGGFTQPNIAAVADMAELQQEAFIQDDWKATRRLTINVGVRYSHFQQPVDNNGLLSSFLPKMYNPNDAPTIDTTGNICTTAEVAATTTTPKQCPGTVNPAFNGTSTATTPNANYDPLNGIVLGNYTATNGHYSPYGSQVAHTDKLNFAPRVGLAYDVFGDGKTSFRMGYGIAFDDALVAMYENNIFVNPPYVTTSNYTIANFDAPSGTNTTTYVPPTLQATPYDYHTPYSQQYSVDMQHLFSHDMTLDVGWFGSHDTHLLGRMDLNEVRPGLAATDGLVPSGGFTSSTQEAVLTQIRPYKGYGPINSLQSMFNSNYNALQVQLQKRFRRGSLIDVNYTWSRNMTNAQADRSGAVQNSYYLVPEYGRSQYDRKHVFTADAVYALPWFYEQEGLTGRMLGGWEVSAIVALNSGLPFTVTTSNWDPAGLGILGTSVVSGRPNQIANPNVAADGNHPIHTRTAWFNTAAFVNAPVCTSTVGCLPGNEHPGSVNGPGFERVDLGLFRNFKVTDWAKLQFRAEAFNLFNHTNWATITTSNTSSTYGQVTATRDPRVLQVALKASF